MSVRSDNPQRRQKLVRALADLVVALTAVGDIAAARHVARLLHGTLQESDDLAPQHAPTTSGERGAGQEAAAVVDLADYRTRRAR